MLIWIFILPFIWCICLFLGFTYEFTSFLWILSFVLSVSLSFGIISLLSKLKYNIWKFWEA